jgi:hypothetical protein
MVVNIENFNKLDEGTQSLINWQYRACGGFERALWTAISTADGDNLTQLGRGFPKHVEAYRNYIGTASWWQDVQRQIAI